MFGFVSTLKDFVVGKAVWLGIGAGATLFLALSAALWHQYHQVGKWRDAAVILNESFAAELAQTQNLRGKLDRQNERIRELADELQERQDQADERARVVLRSRAEAQKRSDSVPPGPDGMNQWFAETLQ